MSDNKDSMKKSRHETLPPNSDPEANPCLEESIMSMKCLERNQNNRDACELYFENYKLCKKFWTKVKIERRRQGILPELPTMEDRKRVMEEHNIK